MGTKIRAKFVIGKKTIHANSYQEITMNAVYSQDPNHENKQFWDATPNGTITMTISKNGGLFEVGKEYFVDFTLAD